VRLLVLGLDEQGRSCVASETEVAPAPIEGLPGVTTASLFSTDQSPPPPCPPGLGTHSPNAIAPGCVHWYIVDHAPARPDERTAGTELHHRDAIDLVLMLEGSGDFLLADGAHPVRAGDCIVMAGIDHGLRAGPDGCRMMSFAIGTPPAQ
jgi:hypothetical protein